MGQVTPKVQAPFTEDQVKSLNNYQVSGVMHPFTCGDCRTRLGTWVGKNIGGPGTLDERLLVATNLVATNDGWTCPTCPTTQDWTWAWMADWTWEQYKVEGFTYPEVER